MVNLSKIIAAVLVLLAILLGVYAWMLGRKPVTPPPSPTTATAPAPQTTTFPVVFITKPITAGTPIPVDALRIEQLPVNPPDALRDVATATGRIPVFDMGANSPVLESQLVSGLALRVQDGERAVAIKADEIMGVGNRIRPGDFVDVFFVLKTDSKEIDNSQVRLLLARKRVLAFGNASIDGMPSKEGNNAQQQQQRSEAARTAVLAVTIEEVNSLALVENSGRLVLALRNPTDTSVPDPTLFAELPAALAARSVKAGQTPPVLSGIDKAHAGLAVTDFAALGDRKPRAVNASTPTRAAAVPVRTSSSNTTPRPRSGNEVEMIRGDKRETLSY